MQHSKEEVLNIRWIKWCSVQYESNRLILRSLGKINKLTTFVMTKQLPMCNTIAYLTNIRWYGGRYSDVLNREDNINRTRSMRLILSSRVNISLHLPPYHLIFMLSWSESNWVSLWNISTCFQLTSSGDFRRRYGKIIISSGI